MAWKMVEALPLDIALVPGGRGGGGGTSLHYMLHVNQVMAGKKVKVHSILYT